MEEVTTNKNVSTKNEESSNTDKGITANDDKFEKIMIDFIKDLKTSFPEFENKLTICFDENGNLKNEYLMEYCKKVYPERFFDFLYKNEDIIDNKDINTEIIPGIDLKEIWKIKDITDSIKETIWKYLQLLMFSIIGDIDDKNIFGNTSKLFEAIDENELKDKMEDTMKGLFELFKNNEKHEEEEDDEDGKDCDENKNSAPEFLNPENISEHISSLLDGKLGQLATEIAEETAKELNIDVNDESTNEEVMKKLFSNPSQLMNLVKKVGGKLDTKIKSGDIKESELMAEATEIMKKMGGSGGMKDMNKILKSMGISPGSIPGMGKGSKINMGALNNQMRKQEALDRARKGAKAAAEKRREQQRLKQEHEEKMKSYKPPSEEEINNLINELQLDVPEPSTTKKKKKKRNKK